MRTALNSARTTRPAMRCAPRQAGLSLVEIMVSMLIGLVIIAALTALFVNSSRSSRELARANGLIESGRFAIEVLEEDIVHAGFWGNFVPQFDDLTGTGVPADTPTAVADPCLAYSASNWNATYQRNITGIGLQVYEMPSTLVSPVCSLLVTNPVADTDVLIVRHADTCIPGAATGGGTCPAINANGLYFQASSCTSDASAFLLQLGSGTFNLRKRNCTTAADVRKFVSDIYYVRDFAVTAGDGIPTLVRSQFEYDPSTATLAQQPPVALVEGIQAFRVELGVDNVSKTGAAVNYSAAVNWQDPLTKTTPTNRGDGVPDGSYVRCTATSPCTVAQLMNVTAVKIYVLARSRDLSQGVNDTKIYTLGAAGAVNGGNPFNDRFRRHVFEEVLRLPNVVGRRLTP